MSKIQELEEMLYLKDEYLKDLEAKLADSEKQLDEAVTLLELFVENEDFMREVHPPQTIENSSVILSFDVYQQYYLQGKRVRKFLSKLEASKGGE